MSYLIHQSWRDAVQWHETGLWRDTTLADFLQANATVRPDDIAIIDGDLEVTWQVLRDATGRFASRLVNMGVERGDVALIQIPDSAALVAAVIAVQAVNAVSAPVSHSAGFQEVSAIAERTSARFYLGVKEPPLEIDISTVLLDLYGPSFWLGEEAAIPPVGYEQDPDALCDLMFTSGTTGRPKGVMNSVNTKLTGLRGFLASFDFSANDVWGLTAPLSHNAGWLYSFLPALATGARSVVIQRGDAARMLETIARQGVTTTFLIPTHLTDLMTEYRTSPANYPIKLRYVVTGAAASPAWALDAIAEEWKATPISMYGMTECQGNLFTRSGDSMETIATTVGRPCPGSEVKLRSPSDGSFIIEEEGLGEIVTRGPTTFLGYFDDQSATSASFTKDGWFRSGDLAMVVDGNFKVVGRIKDVILRGGSTIVPEDIEAAVSESMEIGEIAAVGLPDPRLGELVCLCVAGNAPSRESVVEHLKAAGFGRGLFPDEVVVFESFPHTDLGKIQRAILRRELIARLDIADPA